MRFSTRGRIIEAMPPRLPALALTVLAPALSALAAPARADFIVCNASFDVINLALGADTGGSFGTRGWWTIGPNRCTTLLRGQLGSRYYYVFATDVFGQTLLDGDTEMCVADGRFEITGPEDCWERGHIAAPFAEIDIGTAEAWTLFLGDGGAS